MSARVLVVDDQPLVRDVLRSMLEARGYVVSTACNGTEALAAFATDGHAVAVIDVDMPGPNGVEVCAALRRAASERGRSLPVWLMTGVVRPGLATRAKNAGAQGVLAKPFSSVQLMASLSGALEVAA